MTIVVPYRDRESHLSRFIPHIRAYLPDAEIIVVEQCWSGLFNRGMLLNIGFMETHDTHYIFHDVDMLPIWVDYSPADGITQLALSNIQRKDYLGGVTIFEAGVFTRLNGYPNNFHRAEDNCMMFTIQRSGLRVRYRPGKFLPLPHARGVEFDAAAWEAAKRPRDPENGLIGLNYSCEKVKYPDYTLIKAFPLLQE